PRGAESPRSSAPEFFPASPARKTGSQYHRSRPAPIPWEALHVRSRRSHERAEFAATLQPALGGPVQVLATLRPEFLEPRFKDPDLSKLALRMHEIRPLESDALRSVIEGPAKLAGFSFEEDLVSRLVTDTGTGDALPLLAFTLEQLTHDVK